MLFCHVMFIWRLKFVIVFYITYECLNMIHLLKFCFLLSYKNFIMIFILSCSKICYWDYMCLVKVWYFWIRSPNSEIKIFFFGIMEISKVITLEVKAKIHENLLEQVNKEKVLEEGKWWLCSLIGLCLLALFLVYWSTCISTTDLKSG